MMMFLTLLCVSLFAVAVLSAIVYGSSPSPESHLENRPEATDAPTATRFFAGDLTGPPARTQLPVDAVIAQIERHVRLEQAAAESFLEIPAPDTLHAPTSARFLN